MTHPTNEERTFAAIAHAGIILNGFNLLGLIGAAVIWITQRQRSAFVAAHALQALIFQALGLVCVLVLSGVWGGCLLISLLPALLRPELYRTAPPITFWLALLSGLIILLFVICGVIYGLAGSWAAWKGQPFRYVLVGTLIARRQLDKTQPASSPVPNVAIPAPAVPPIEATALASTPLTTNAPPVTPITPPDQERSEPPTLQTLTPADQEQSEPPTTQTVTPPDQERSESHASQPITPATLSDQERSEPPTTQTVTPPDQERGAPPIN